MGRIVTIVYALLGIPLTFLYLSNIGNFMANCFRMFYKRVCCDILCCQKCDRDRQRLRFKQRRQRELAVQRNILLGLHPAFIGCNPADATPAAAAADSDLMHDAHITAMSAKADINMSPNATTEEHSIDNDVISEPDVSTSENGCRNGCRTPPRRRISIISREFSSPSSVQYEGSVASASSSSLVAVSETGSSKSISPEAVPELVSIKNESEIGTPGTVRETAIMGNSSDEQLDYTGSSPSDVISGAGLIRRVLSKTNVSRRPSKSSNVFCRNLGSRLLHGPETDILFSEADTFMGNNFRVTPEVETYLHLPVKSVFRRDTNRPDNVQNDAIARRNIVQSDMMQTDSCPVRAYEQPEVVSTTTTTTTTMSAGRRSSSADVINRLGIDLPVPATIQRHSSSVDQQQRRPQQKPEVRRRRPSPVARRTPTAAMNASEEHQARAMANWSRLREHFQQHRIAVDDEQLRIAALRLLQGGVQRSRSSVRRGGGRRRTSRDRRRAKSVEATRRRRGLSSGSKFRGRASPPEDGNLPDASFRSTIDGSEVAEPEVADNGVAIPIHGTGSVDDDVEVAVNLAAAAAVVGAGLPYDYEPLDFEDRGGEVAFNYTDDPFEYDDAGAGHDGGKVTVPITICLIIIAGYIFAGAVLFTLWEDWDYLTGSYFCFITLSTIGFGDIVPGTDMDSWASSEKLVLCALWLAFGLSLLAMCFNLMQEEVRDKSKWLGLKLGLLRDDEPR